MSDRLKSYGWNAAREAEFEDFARKGLLPGRIIGEEKGGFAVLTAGGERPGVLAGKHRDGLRPAVGDWTACFDGGNGPLRVEALLERRSLLSRGKAGTGTEEQILAANVDTAFLVMALDADFNLRRLERHLTAVWESGARLVSDRAISRGSAASGRRWNAASRAVPEAPKRGGGGARPFSSRAVPEAPKREGGGARPVVVLSKLDVAEDPEGMRLAAEAAAPGADVLTLSARTGEGLPSLLAHLRPAETAILLGSSGVGKSTLTNLLLGREAQSVQWVRENDSKGRHTTTGRRLFRLESGALLIDTPGMREFRLWEDGDGGLDRTFEDVSALAAACRFGDCRHESEPGCAVLEALASGRLERKRLESWLKLGRELAFAADKNDKAKRSNSKKRWKKIHEQMRRRRKIEEG